MAVEASVGVEHERDVAVRAPAGLAACTAVKSRGDPAPVQQEDRLAAVLLERRELGEERCRERIARFPAEVDDLDDRERAGEALAELEPFQRLPALGPRSRGSEDGYGAFEPGSLGGDGARVVTGVGLLFVGGVVLLVDADDAEPGDRREDGRPRADDDRRSPARDSGALVAPLCLREPRMENGDAVTESRAQPAHGLRGKRDLGDEDDRAAPSLERRGTGLEIDLGLAASRRTLEQEVAAAGVHRLDDALERPLLTLAQRVWLGLAAERVPLAGRGPFAASFPLQRRDELEGAGGCRAVVVGQPECEVDERPGQLVDDVPDGHRLDAFRRALLEPDDDSTTSCPVEKERNDRALSDVLRHFVGEGSGNRP